MQMPPYRALRRFLIMSLAIASQAITSQFAHAEGKGREKINMYLCQTKSTAIAFAAQISSGVTEEMARNEIDRRIGVEVCNRYMGEAIVEEEEVSFTDGYLYKSTKFRVSFADKRGDLVGWFAERVFAVEQTPKVRRL
jgi:hypothetical protein